MWHGKSMPIQSFPFMLERETGGTVKAQSLNFNIAAQNGTWLARELIDNKSNQVAGWFVCHSDVDAETEIDKILRVSGSPYEPESGSSFFDETTAAEGVLPINRYDWGYYDRRYREEFEESEALLQQGADRQVFSESVGLVDYAHAEEYINQWKNVATLERENQEHGLWMSTFMEYRFGRFGFNDEHTAARSFLWFTTNTDFTQTCFAGLERTLRIYETSEEIFQRYLKKGTNYDGLETIHKMARWEPRRPANLPTETECLGPYDPNDYILHEADCDALRAKASVHTPAFPAQWNDTNIELLNNMIMTYLERVIAPASSPHDTTTSAAASLFPRRETDLMDRYMYGYLTNPSSQTIEGYDGTAVGQRIKTFLTSRCGESSLLRDGEFLAGLAACVAYLAKEVLELANNCRRDHAVSAMVPSHMRLAVMNDEALLDMFKFSKVYWYGGLFGWVAADDDAGEGVDELAEQVTQSQISES